MELIEIEKNYKVHIVELGKDIEFGYTCKDVDLGFHHEFGYQSDIRTIYEIDYCSYVGDKTVRVEEALINYLHDTND